MSSAVIVIKNRSRLTKTVVFYIHAQYIKSCSMFWVRKIKKKWRKTIKQMNNLTAYLTLSQTSPGFYMSAGQGF